MYSGGREHGGRGNGSGGRGKGEGRSEKGEGEGRYSSRKTKWPDTLGRCLFPNVTKRAVSKKHRCGHAYGTICGKKRKYVFYVSFAW